MRTASIGLVVLAATSLVRTPDSVKLERTACSGTCAAYVITINEGGAVVFTFKGGVQHATVDASSLQAILMAMDTSGFFTMPSYAETTAVCRKGFWTDFPSAIVTAAYKGRTHAVEHYQGCPGAPKVLRTIEHMVDSVGGSSRYLNGDFGSPDGSTFMRSP